jgi:tRNA(fMet)-specific endonuclease VapC
MLQFLLDTDHLTLVERGHAPLVQRVTAQPAGAVGTSAVTVEEALRGRLASLARPLGGAARVRGYALLLGTVRLFNHLPLLPFDQAAETEYQRLRAQHPRLGTQDLRIAAVAFVNALTLLTRNRRDFSLVPSLRIDDWSV